MVKYTQIIDAFKQFCTKHQQINTFYSGQEWDFQTENNMYPALVLLPQPSVMSNGAITLTFNLFVADIMHKELIASTDDIYSDTLLILQDVIAYFTDNEDYDFNIVDDVNIEPFEEKLDDILCGWSAAINIKFRFGGSNCNLPMED